MSSVAMYSPGDEDGYEVFAKSLVEENLESQLSTMRLVGGNIDVSIPEPLLRVLRDVTVAFSRGASVTITPVDEMVSTQQAADMLNVSRPTLVAMLDEGRIPYERARSHRRIRRSDVEAYVREHRREARRALDQIAGESYEAGEYEITKDEALVALQRYRQSR